MGPRLLVVDRAVTDVVPPLSTGDTPPAVGEARRRCAGRARLRDAGALSDTEFEADKAKLLA
jgi:hypothetical protein